ncbi:cobyrinate a,c-diamide synthase [Lichenibacterium dinghuense]|uniref:cobyrinate a,c-diamide synthase n=1 Tax=Lichenibacterium dinghuense TaxID=2895977 RepID=UPI001F006EF5|nr:cobyrinate a,c-diamide synthase [Lichenibacterium sp. 6Y81]
MIAATRSGSGKTVLTLGLMRALGRRGLRVAGRKNGPDYIDPAFHAAVTGRPSYNLDSWSMPAPLLLRLAGAGDADIVVCEGSMGLFDGVPAGDGQGGSSADVAALTGWPVVMVHDCSGQSQSAAAILTGCRDYDPRIRVAGVILNRVASERHRRLVSDAMARVGVPVLGSVPRTDRLALPERHLGLVQAGETGDLAVRVDAAADVVEEHVDLDALLDVAGASPSPLAGEGGRAKPGRMRGASAAVDDRPLDAGRTAPSPLIRQAPPDTFSREARRDVAPLLPPGQRIAVARDDAFSFLYPHVVEGWRAAGAELTFFSPLADEPTPPDCDSGWLPGGYPELHAGRIAAASRFLRGLRAFARTRPVHGECGGYMVLGSGLVDAEGVRHAMAGLLGLETSYAKRKLHLGYRDAVTLAPSALGPAGTRLRGHEFHYASILDLGGDAALAEAADAYGSAPAPTGTCRGNVTGTFFHALASHA